MPGIAAEQALALRAACLGWLPCGGLLARLADPSCARGCGAPLALPAEIDAIARTLGRPGIWLLHGAYLFGCTALADESADGPACGARWTGRSRLGRLVEVVRQRGEAGEFLNVTWPGFAGVLTAVAPDASPPRSIRRRCAGAHRSSCCCGSTTPERPGGLARDGRPPPEHSFRAGVRDLRDVR